MKEVFVELLSFLFSKKSRMILIPFLIVLLILSALFVFASGSSWAPFIYAIF
ncbi:DUF5989 family protein [Celerinatantimonas sp. YJH-8]|uniref:DUF5989 family protein n=1 Tax=Celerinatantimonas sp. YJH-8 TaxID=3228714 RepID=UPI0038C093A7